MITFSPQFTAGCVTVYRNGWEIGCLSKNVVGEWTFYTDDSYNGGGSMRLSYKDMIDIANKLLSLNSQPKG